MAHNSPRHQKIANENTILRTEVGSGVLGVAIQGTDDHDEMGICIEPPEEVIGLGGFEQRLGRWHADGTPIPEGERSGHGDTDFVVYGLRKWTKLAAQGNPTVLIPVFAPAQSIYYVNQWGNAVIHDRNLFLTKEAGKRFLGYSNSQYQQLTGTVERRHSNRPELIDKYGYDTKFAYHAVRLTWQGIELMETGQIELPLCGVWRDELLKIRNGEYALSEVIDMVETGIRALKVSIKHSKLPDRPDLEKIDRFLVSMYQTWWRSKGLV